VLLVAGLALWAGFRIKMLPVGIIMPALTLIGCVYEVLARIIREDNASAQSLVRSGL
jgi:hypothetical protein